MFIRGEKSMLEAMSLLVDDLQAEHEFFDVRRAMSALQTPELRLMFEVLADAVRVYQGDIGCHRQGKSLTTRSRAILREEAEAWIFDRWSDCDDSIFAFGSICAVLGIDRDKLRAGLVAAKADGTRRIGRRRPARSGYENIGAAGAWKNRGRQGVGSRGRTALAPRYVAT
jgi:hypothetical protein